MLDTLRVFLGTRWAHLTWVVFDWLASAKLVTLTLLVFTAVAMLASTPRYRRRMMILGLSLLAVYWFVVSPLFSVPAIGLLTRFVPPDTGQTADVVVVLARPSEARGERYETAVAMMEAGRAERILVMGRYPAEDVFEKLEQRQLSPERLTSAICVRTTLQEAESAAVLLSAQNLNHIVLITDQPHMLRAWLTFKGFGFAVIPHMEPIQDWVAHHERSFWRFANIWAY
ncbi:MAG: YdcF family protein [Leptolyngbyaceae cyanobacterium SM2_5_2]|nr:YdcF family protein [Leptolyngbyaceae cyanobacterium SM2_5_2]